MNLRSRTAEWFNVKIRYEKTMEDGTQKKVSENYVVDALSFTEGEGRMIDEMSAYISGEFTVDDMKKCPFKEIFFNDSDAADRWYKAKLAFLTIDVRTKKEKRTNCCYLVQAGTLQGAVMAIEEIMGTTMMDYIITSVAETSIMDVFEYQKKEQNEQPEYEQ